MDSATKIIITRQIGTVDRLHDLLEDQLDDSFEVVVDYKTTRSADASIVVAYIGLFGTIVSTVITAIFAILPKLKETKIVIVHPNGTRIELPQNSNTEQVNSAIALSTTNGIKRIEINS